MAAATTPGHRECRDAETRPECSPRGVFDPSFLNSTIGSCPPNPYARVRTPCARQRVGMQFFGELFLTRYGRQLYFRNPGAIELGRLRARRKSKPRTANPFGCAWCIRAKPKSGVMSKSGGTPIRSIRSGSLTSRNVRSTRSSASPQQAGIKPS